MKDLNDKDLMKVDGGGFSLGFALGLPSIVAFLVGVFDGIVRPFKCRF